MYSTKKKRKKKKLIYRQNCLLWNSNNFNQTLWLHFLITFCFFSAKQSFTPDFLQQIQLNEFEKLKIFCDNQKTRERRGFPSPWEGDGITLNSLQSFFFRTNWISGVLSSVLKQNEITEGNFKKKGCCCFFNPTVFFQA